jgi:hypothetical protein
MSNKLLEKWATRKFEVGLDIDRCLASRVGRGGKLLHRLRAIWVLHQEFITDLKEQAYQTDSLRERLAMTEAYLSDKQLREINQRIYADE